MVLPPAVLRLVPVPSLEACPSDILEAEGPPTWLFDPVIERIVAANPAGLAFWGETSLYSLAERSFALDEPFTTVAREVDQTQKPRLARLSFLGAVDQSAVACHLRPAKTIDNRPAVQLSLQPWRAGPTHDPALLRLAEALRALPVAMLLSRAGGEVIATSQALDRLCPQGGKTLGACLGRDGAQAVAQSLAKTSHVSRSLALGAERRPCHVEGRRLRDPVDGAPLDVIILRDLSGLAAVEAETAETRARINRLLDMASAFVWESGPDGRLRLLSRGFETLTGLAPAALIGRSWIGMPSLFELEAGAETVFALAPDRIDGLALTVTPPGRSAVAVLLSARAIRDKDGVFQGYLGVGQRTSPPAEPAQLRTERDRLAAFVDTTTEGVLGVDRQGRITFANRAAGALLGRAPSQLRGGSIAELIAPQSRKVLAQALAPTNAADVKDRHTQGYDVELVGADGGRVALRIAFHALAVPPGLCVTLSNMRQARRIEAELRRALNAAEAANRQKSEFLAKVSHELRTPLNAIIGFAEMMRDERLGPLGNARYAGYVRDIHHSGNLLLSLINDLLDLSKVESGRVVLRRAEVDIRPVIEQTVSLMQPAADAAAVALEAHIAADLPRVLADERSVEQIVLNLVSNAIKFTRPRGRVLVTADASAKGGVTLSVRDTGIGMSDADLKVALEPFQRVERGDVLEKPGTGLGLPLAKALVEANNAEFRITSAPKAGTAVEINFPKSRLAMS